MLILLLSRKSARGVVEFANGLSHVCLVGLSKQREPVTFAMEVL